MGKKRTIDRKHCVGCYDDFYNSREDIGGPYCWGLPHAKIVTRYQIHKDTPMGLKSGYSKVRVPSCFHQQDYVFEDKIPESAK